MGLPPKNVRNLFFEKFTSPGSPKKFSNFFLIYKSRLPPKISEIYFLKNLQVQAPPKNFGNLFFEKFTSPGSPQKISEIYFLKILQVQAPPKNFGNLFFEKFTSPGSLNHILTSTGGQAH